MTVLPVAVPVDVERDEARRAARDELSRSIYHEDDPTLAERAMRWIVTELGDLLDRAAGAAPGGYAGLVALVALLVVAVVAIRLKVGPVARAAQQDQPLFLGREQSAAAHRTAAEQHAAAGRWAEAVRESVRALVRDLEQRGLVEPRPGRTADEAATEAGAAMPAYTAPLRSAARVFDDVCYGGRPATSSMYTEIRDLDEQLRRSRPAPARVGA